MTEVTENGVTELGFMGVNQPHNKSRCLDNKVTGILQTKGSLKAFVLL